MGFSEKLREGLGAEGARLELALNSSRVSPSDTFAGTVHVTGGTKPARIDAVVLRLIQAQRHWKEADGTAITEDDARARPDRRELSPVWERSVIQERRIAVNRLVEPDARDAVEFQLWVPDSCNMSSSSCTYMINVQADIKGQIDPTANANVTIG